MANKKVVFESERVERRQWLKTLLIPGIIVLALLLIALGIFMVSRLSRGRIRVGGEGSAYPYTWTAARDGSVTLVLEHAAAPDYTWLLAEESTGVQVQMTGDSEKNGTVFTITPEGAGRASLHFRLQRGGDVTDRIYDRTLLLEFTQSNRGISVELIGDSGAALQGVLRDTSRSDYPYAIWTDEDGDLVLSMLYPEIGPNTDPDWSCVSEDESVAAVLGVIRQENAVQVYLRAGESEGETRVTLREAVTGAELTVTCRRDADGALLVLSHALTLNQ